MDHAVNNASRGEKYDQSRATSIAKKPRTPMTENESPVDERIVL